MQKEAQQLRAMVDQVRTFSDYLGDEIVLAVPAVEEAAVRMMVAEAKKAGFGEQFIVGRATAPR